MALVFALMFVFAQLGAADALYYHFWKFRLFALPETRREHAVHTMMSVGFWGVVWGLWYLRPQGAAWWAMAVWQGVTLGLTFVDVRMEPRTRRGFGGLRAGEYMLHMLMNTLHGIAVAAWVAATSADARLPTGVPRAHFAYPWPVNVVAGISLVAAALMPAVHVYLLLHGRRNPTTLRALAAAGLG